MAFVAPSRVLETFTTPGTGTVTLGGALVGYRTFASAMSNGDTCHYFMEGGSDWEEGYGTYSAGTLARTTVLRSSNANAAVNWAAGTKTVGIGMIGPSDLDSTNRDRFVDLLAVAKLSGAAFTGAVSVGGAQTPLTLTYSDDGAGQGPYANFMRESTSPAANDLIAAIQALGRDSAANLQTYGTIVWAITDPTSGSEDAALYVQTVGAGSLGTRLTVALGLQVGAPTGGDKGIGTVNAAGVYDDNTLLTCMAMADTFLKTGAFTDDDVAEWDARVPDQIEPARTEQLPIMDKVPSRQIVRDDDGSLKVAIIETERQRTEPVPLYDVDGMTGIDMVEEPVFETVEIPEKIIPRTHAAARVFKAMIDDGFDPRDPAAYIAKMRADEALPGMPTKHDWQHNGLSSGEMMSRLWLATEMLALAFATLTERVAAIEAR